MRIFRIVAAVGLLFSTAACAVYTRDYPYDGYAYRYQPRAAYYAYAPPPPRVAYYAYAP
jgi:hypothetical protein